MNFITPNRRQFGGNIQKCIDYAIEKAIPTVYIPKGVYEVERLNVANPKGQVVVNITGEPVAYTGQPSTTVIRCGNTSGSALNVDCGKGVNIRNLQLVGLNQLNYSFGEWGSFVAKGIEDSRYNPHAGISFDKNVKAGSTDCKVENVSIDGFVVGVAVSPNGKSQNGDSLIFDRMWVNNAKVAFAMCQSQTRMNVVTNLKCWNSIQTVFHTWAYGQGNGELPKVKWVNLAGSIYELFQTNNGWSSGNFEDVYAELIYRLGDAVGGRLPIAFNNCHFDFAVKDYYPENIATGDGLTFNGTTIRYYDGREDWKPLNFNSGTNFKGPVFRSCYLNNPASFGNGSDHDESFVYDNCTFKTGLNYSTPVFSQKYDEYMNYSEGLSGNTFTMKEWAGDASKYYEIGQPVISRMGVVGVVDKIEGRKVTLRDMIKAPDKIQVGFQKPMMHEQH